MRIVDRALLVRVLHDEQLAAFRERGVRVHLVAGHDGIGVRRGVCGAVGLHACVPVELGV